ncbi:MAG TPA: YkvA family protein [Hyphomicrobiales bacterium]|nr:YkvA family protein [Kaistiaceae bacterium]HQF30367.1 YkvA family protein [Hyphomicrobiales bacterium]
MARTHDGTLDPDEIIMPKRGENDAADEARRAARDEKNVRKNFWATVRKAARYIPFMEEVIAAYYCALDPETPFRVRATLIGALAYFVMPIDAIPDFILAVGFTDDAALLASVIAMVRAHIRPEHRDAARRVLAEEQIGPAA